MKRMVITTLMVMCGLSTGLLAKSACRKGQELFCGKVSDVCYCLSQKQTKRLKPAKHSIGLGPVVISSKGSRGIQKLLAPKAVVSAARQAAVQPNVTLPHNFGLNFKKFRSTQYGQCYFFPTRKSFGVTACRSSKGTILSWYSKSQCQAGVAPLSSQKDTQGRLRYLKLGSYAQEMLMGGGRRMGGRAKQCTVYGEIDRRSIGGLNR